MSDKFQLLIGCDPDSKVNGICVYEPHNKTFEFENCDFFGLFDLLTKKYSPDHYDVKVILEAGWLNKSNWHTNDKQSRGVTAMIGSRTGANHEVGRKIEEMLKYLNIPYTLVKPSTAKVDAKLFQRLTLYSGRTNQEQRDACMLCYGRTFNGIITN